MVKKIAKTQENEKKPTNGQLLQRINKAIVHMDRTKDTKEVFFDDRGMRITVNEDMAMISNGIYQSIFHRYSANGETSQYLCLSSLVALALKYEEDIKVRDSKGNVKFRSYALLLKVVDEKKDPMNTWLYIMDKWLYNYETGIVLAPRESFNAATFYNIFEKFAHSIATNKVYMAEHKEEMSVKQYFEAIAEELKKTGEGMPDTVMFVALSDEEKAKQEAEAMEANAIEQTIENAVENGKQ